MASKKVILKKTLDDEIHRLNTIKNSNKYKKVFKLLKYADAVLRTRDGIDIRINRNIVASNSGYFSALFENNHNEIIEINDDISGKNLEMIIDYMYKIPEIRSLAIRPENIIILNKYANKYLMTILENETTKILSNNINSETCLEYWRHAGEMRKFDLEQECFNYILKNTEDFFASSITELTFKELEAIVSNPRVTCTQESLYTNIILWIKSDFKDHQQYIKDLLTNVNFSKFSNDFLYIKVLNDTELWISNDFVEITLNNVKLKLCDDEFKINPDAKTLNMLYNNDYISTELVNHNSKLNENVTNMEKLKLNVDEYIDFTLTETLNTCLDEHLKYQPNYEPKKIANNRKLKINNDKCLLINQNDLYDINFVSNTFHKICKHNRRWNFAVNAYKSNFILLSGGGYWNGSNTCQFYNDSTKELQNFAIMREQRRRHRTILMNDQIYACGGSSKMGSIEICDLNTEKWIKCESNMLDKDRNFGIATYGGCLYTFGGTINYGNSNTVELFDPRDGKWNDLKMNLNTLEETRSVCCYNSIFCFGSTYGQIFDVRQNRWKDRINYSNDIKKLSNFDVVEMNNKFYIASTSMLTQKIIIFVYDHQSNDWSTVSDNNAFKSNSTGELHFAKISSNEWRILK